MVLLNIPDWRREVLTHIKHFMHTFSTLEYSHFIGILYVIIDIKDVFIELNMMLITNGSAYHKPQEAIQVNTLVLGIYLITVSVQVIDLVEIT